MGEAMSTGMLATIIVFVLAIIFGLVLWADAKKTTKTERAATPTAKPTTPPSAVEAESQPDSWKKSAERFKSTAD
jgi:cytochrome oxidase assembly protein ShyY1